MLTVIIILLVAALVCAIVAVVKYPSPAPSTLVALAIVLLCIVGLIEHIPLGK